MSLINRIGRGGTGGRGLFGGGKLSVSYLNIIEYVTIAITGNVTDFGDLSAARDLLAGCSSSTRGIFGGGSIGNSVNTIEYVTIATTGNVTDFGDLSAARALVAGCSSTVRGLCCGG